MTRRTVFILAALASLTAFPAFASADTRRAPSVRVRSGEDAEAYARRADVAMASAKRRIQSKAEGLRMSDEQRSKLHNDVHQAIQVLRGRIGQRGADGWITPAEDRDVSVLHDAIRAELAKSYGNIDSWQLL